MPSTYTTNTGIEKPGDGEQAGAWGNTANSSYDIIDRAMNGVVSVTLSSSTYTLTTSNGTLSEGQYAAILFTGTPGATCTVTIAPATAQKTYLMRNGSNQSVVITQGSGGNVTILAGRTALVACNGGGASAAVFDITALMNTATNANTASAVVQRDASGNFSAGTITATLSGNSSSATQWSTARTLTIGSTGKSVDGSGNVSWTLGEIGAQAADNALTSLAGLSWVADRYPYTDGTDSFAMGVISSFARQILDDSDGAAVLATIGAQASDADLTAIAGLSANGIVTRTGAGTAAARTITASASNVTITNGDGVSGNPTVGVTTQVALQNLQNTTSGTTFDWTGVPADCSEIYVFFLQVSGTATSQNLIQLMVSGTPVTSGYYNTEAGSTAGFSLPSLGAANTGTGIVKIMRVNGNTWVMESGASGTAGWKTFSGVVNGVRLTSTAGTFDGGQAGVSWRV